VYCAETEQIEKAIVHILTEGMPEHKIKPFPRHRFIRDKAARRALARSIVFSGNKQRISPWILVAIAFREGSFVGKKAGLLKEESTFQIVPKNIPWLKKIEPGCSLESVQGAALCAATLLRHNYDKCGSMNGALTLYATGKRCKSDNPHVKWLVRDRQGIERKLERKFGKKAM